MITVLNRFRTGARGVLQLLLLLQLCTLPVWSRSLWQKSESICQLESIQLRADEEAIAAVLQLDGVAPQFSVLAQTAPERIVVELQQCKNARGDVTDYEQLITRQMRNNGLARVLVNQFGGHVRVTFYLTQKLRYRIQRDKGEITILLDITKHKDEADSDANSAPPAPVQSVNQVQPLTQAWRQANVPDSSWSPKAPLVETASKRAGQKSFAEGLQFEKKQEWDLAFQNFTVAVAAEPDNPEYRLHAQRAAVNAAVLLTKQGDLLVQQNDPTGALRAYQRAVSMDATNEQARTKLQQLRALVQKATDAVASAPANIPPVATPDPKNNQTIYFSNASLRQVIEVLAKSLELNVMFDESFRDEPRFRLSLDNVSVSKALDQVLLQTKHTFERTDHRTLLIYQDNPQNRQRFEQLMFKTFYLANADLNEARTLVQSVIGQQRQVLPVKNLNALVVRDTPANLQIVQELLDSIDKNRAEVLVDVDIYEVSRSTSTAIGNQLATSAVTTTAGTGTNATTRNSASLGNLGGIGLSGITSIAGQTATAALGTIIGLPPSTLSLLKSKSNSKLLASTQIHALDGEQNQTKVGRSVPVRIGTSIIPTIGTTTGTGTTGISSGNFDSIQYRDVGLIIDLTPTVNNEGWVQIKMKLESSSVEAAASVPNLTPTFSQRSLSTIARVMDGRTAIVAGVKQESKGDSRSGVPVIGMVPILGRLFSTPQEESSLSDIIITVTPHVVRASTIRPQDYRARLGGSFLTGVNASIDELLRRIEEEELQHRGPRFTNTITAITSASNPRSAVAPVNAPENNAPAADSTEANQIGTVSFSLTPSIISSKVNESFYVAVTISGTPQINEVAFGLSYDPSLFQLKGIQNGDLLGKQATITPQGENGVLRFQVQQEANLPPVQAQGQILILEMVGLRPGRASLSFTTGDERIKLGKPLPAQFQSQGAEIEVK